MFAVDFVDVAAEDDEDAEDDALDCALLELTADAEDELTTFPLVVRASSSTDV